MIELKKGIKRILKVLIPRPIINILLNSQDVASTFKDNLRDTVLYQKHMASTDRAHRTGKFRLDSETQIIKDYHRIEKGLALKETKKTFGLEIRDRLSYYISREKQDSPLLSHAVQTIEALDDWNNKGVKSDLVSPVQMSTFGHLENAEEFFATRRSVRDFSTENVETSDVIAATALALNTPSVCNRQPWKIRHLTSPSQIKEALSFQNGNSGFGSQIKVLSIISVDLRLFSGSSERNQAWIEGGLFAMTYVWAVHAKGLQSCMLNLSLSYRESQKLKKALQIPSHEVPIVMVGVGKGAPGHRVALSPRREASEVIVNSPPVAD
jgi:nitroreductase